MKSSIRDNDLLTIKDGEEEGIIRVCDGCGSGHESNVEGGGRSSSFGCRWRRAGTRSGIAEEEKTARDARGRHWVGTRGREWNFLSLGSTSRPMPGQGSALGLGSTSAGLTLGGHARAMELELREMGIEKGAIS